jgi:hypothetical protein
VVWGQSDSVVALPMIAAALLILAGRHKLGWSVAAIAILAKPQAIAVAIPLGLWTLLDAGIAECAWCGAAFAGTFALGILPYQVGHPWNWIINVYKDMGTRFSDASVGAFNFMGLIGGMNADDNSMVLGVSYRALGLAMTAAVYVISSYLIWRARSAFRDARDLRGAVRILHVRPAHSRALPVLPGSLVDPNRARNQFPDRALRNRHRNVPIQLDVHQASIRHVIVFPRPPKFRTGISRDDQPGNLLRRNRLRIASDIAQRRFPRQRTHLARVTLSHFVLSILSPFP